MPAEKTFTEIKQLVQNHFNPKLSEASASLIFHTSESITLYVAELRRLAVPCNFGAYLDCALRDHFIAGINNYDMQEKILCARNRNNSQ